MKPFAKHLLPAIAAALTCIAAAEPTLKPLKALLIIGGCCHDYATQKEILSAGIAARANIQVDVCYSPNTSTKATFSCYDKANWADGYDVIIHDECSADIKDVAVVNRILEPHRKGVPAVNLHCAMHCYRTAVDVGKPAASGTEGALWFDFLGLQSSGHGAQLPIEVSYLDAAKPISQGLEDWTTIKEELYNNISIHCSAKPLACGKQGATTTVIVWTNEYGDNKTRVFSTTLGHSNETVSDKRYLDLVTRGLLWSCNKLGSDGSPHAGYARPAAAGK
ncbi:MAG: ThuA domain-containing protein [Verrucomicrobia bacterium]|nr:MAG: ThuA domain-containing protein [Verrucomicrobiota bacterium]